MIFSSTKRPLALAVLLVVTALVVLSLLYYSPSFRQYSPYPPSRLSFSHTYSPLHSCPPRAYASGNWTRKIDPQAMASKDDVLAVAGFDGCASSREVAWHLGTSWADDHDAANDDWKRSWRGNASAYDWVPDPDACSGYSKPDAAAILRQLVEDGGWFILGDSITEGHFFSLSCMLYPHVRATPDYTRDWSFDRAWPQNLYLDPTSPLLPQLTLPPGFELDKTPLATFRRVDLLLGKAELNALYAQLHPTDAPASLFSDEGTWDLDPATYLPEFLAPLPAANYRTLILSTAGHWTTTLFSAFHTGDAGRGHGLAELLDFFRAAMGAWAERVAAALAAAPPRPRSQKQRQVVVRAYLHGHEACHDRDVELGRPWARYLGLRGSWYNWNWIPRFNDAFEAVIEERAHPNIHFLSIDMPGLLRPEGHVQGDCLHVLTGAGIMEGWTEYISYYVSRLP